MSKLKGKNWKEMALGHGEKVVLGGVILFVLTTVVSARWGTYQKQPLEFEQAVRTEDAAFATSVFPPEQRAEFDATFADDIVESVLAGNTGSYEYSTVWLSPIYKPKAKLKEPTYFPVEDLYADSSKALLQLAPEQPESSGAPQIAVKVDDGTGTPSPNPAGPVVPGVAGPRVDGPRGAAAGAVGPGGSIGAGPATAGLGTDPALNTGDQFAGNGYPGSSYPGGGGTGSMGSNYEARGARFVAVRGVLPHKSLIQSYKKALNAETIQEAAQQIEYWDFELQRKAAVPGAADPWSADWEPVDIEVAVELRCPCRIE
jgi:hypothetical protein